MGAKDLRANPGVDPRAARRGSLLDCLLLRLDFDPLVADVEPESGVAAQVGESCPFPELSRGRWHGRRRLMLADGMMAIAKNGLRHVPLAATGKITLISGMRGRCHADVFVAAHESVHGLEATCRSR